MAHFAKIENKLVSQVIVIANEAIGDTEFPESEALGQQVIANSGFDGIWKQTSYNCSFRGKFAGGGDTYDSELDTFIAPELPTQEEIASL